MNQFQHKYHVLSLFFLAAIPFVSCNEKAKPYAEVKVYKDVPFIQETHDGYKISENADDNEVRSIAVDKQSTVWVATASGIFSKKAGTRQWELIVSGENRGPAYSVVVKNDGTVLLGTWNGLYSLADHQ